MLSANTSGSEESKSPKSAHIASQENGKVKRRVFWLGRHPHMLSRKLVFVLLIYIVATRSGIFSNFRASLTPQSENESIVVSDNTTVVKAQEPGFKFSSEKTETQEKGNLGWMFWLVFLGFGGILIAYMFDLHHDMAWFFRHKFRRESTKIESGKELNTVKLKAGENKRTPGGKLK